MNFGKYTIISDVAHQFTKEPEWWWKFRPTTSIDELAMRQFEEQNGVPAEIDGRQVKLRPDWHMLAWRELAMSFGGTNIPTSESGDPVLTEKDVILWDDSPALRDKKIARVEAVLKAMPDQMLAELWIALGDANPFWGPHLEQGAKPHLEESQDQENPEDEQPKGKL